MLKSTFIYLFLYSITCEAFLALNCISARVLMVLDYVFCCCTMVLEKKKIKVFFEC